MNKYQEILKQYWGYDSFRDLQEEIITSIGEGKDTLGLMPTGGGKSITFQVPALAQEGICIVITPLIALMKDQVQNLRKRGIMALAVYSGMTRQEILTALENCIFGDYKFLYISPERVDTEIFRTKLKAMKVSMITVDESHCISQWGYDFRPAYLKIAEIRELLPGVPVLALTATATPEVVKDIQNRLNFHEGNVFRMSFERKNLAYIVRKTDNKTNELLHILRKIPGSAIIYVRNRRRTKEITELLVNEDITADFYHAGLDNAVKDFTVSDGKVNGQSNLTITVENDYTKLDLAKVDSGTGENISGAKLSLLDSNGRLVESWTSGSTPHRIEKLKPGQYTLREDQAPDYYKLADPITFTLESKADTQTITMKDMRYADLTVVKKIKASDITWAHGNPTFIFTVKGKDINGKDRTFQNYVEFTENYVNSHTDGQGYVELSVTWNKIPVGEDYTVTEQDVLRYHLVNVTGTENVKISKLQEPAKGVAPDKIFSVHANLKAKPTGTSITFENQKDDWGTTTHDTSVKNIIPLK